MKKSDVSFKDSEFTRTKLKNHNIKVIHNREEDTVFLKIPMNDLKVENLTLSEDKKYYLLFIKPKFIHPENPEIEIEIDFKLAIEKETHDKKKEKLEDIVKRVIYESDLRSYFSQNYDGRMQGVYYGGSF